MRKSAYRDSVALLALARALRATPGVTDTAALMATEANKALLARSGLLTEEAAAAGPNDLVIVIQTAAQVDAERARAQAEEMLASGSRRALAQAGRALPRTVGSATRRLAGANLALISVPGAYAAAEALKALRLGLHVMLFSDNVRIEDEVELKRLAVSKGLLLMGPDCGTAYLNGVPLGFANAVPRGRIGIVAASGTGLQQVAALLAGWSEGISHAIGVGGRDLSDAVGGLMTFQALDALAGDRTTELIMVISKPPGNAVRERVARKLRELRKPAVVVMLGRGIEPRVEGNVATVVTLEDAAVAALAALGAAHAGVRSALAAAELRRRVEQARRELQPEQRALRALYAGGTLAQEALLVLDPLLLGAIETNLEPGSNGVHQILDLGADELTVGRAHPMLDPTSRIEAIERVAKEPDVAVLLVDVVLGHGAARDPAGDIAPALEAARAEARAQGRDLAVVATVVGTADDPQGLAGQIERLETAGAWVLPSNAQAARVAACIAGGEHVMNAVLGAGE